ncbi:MAG: hypothetical protein H0X12_05340 [Nocardioides sp.]|nr:hypothetical protein [Nocardioides sp.]
MSEHEGESPQAGITDDQLPEDLQPGEANPLAEPLDPDDVDRDLEMDATQEPDESDDSEESEGSRESDTDD